MIQVYVELTNIVWEDDKDSSIAYEQGSNKSFVVDIILTDHLHSDDIDSAIADTLETASGHRPMSWDLDVFENHRMTNPNNWFRKSQNLTNSKL
jgi:hypothetical protein